MSVTVYDCSVIELPRIENRAGNITPMQSGLNVPFCIRRVFYTYDIPGGEARGAHAHKECHQFLSSGAICLVLASEKYEESDYIRDYNDFLNFRNIK